MYHSIADGSKDPYAVSIDAFREQIAWLLENGFDPIPLEVLVHLSKAKDYKALKKKVVFTFDDGYRDFIMNALPLLKRYGVTATVFLVTGMLGGQDCWKKNDRGVSLMGEDEVIHIKTQGISLGSHTTTHANMKIILDRQELQRQLSESYDALTHLGESFYAFSYPWGQWSTGVVETVKASGYECAVKVGGEMRLDKIDVHLLPRITMRGDMGIDSFQAIFSRKTYIVQMLRRYLVTLRYVLTTKRESIGVSIP